MPRSDRATRRSTCRAPRLMDDIAIARADGRLSRLLTTWARADVMVIDDFVLRSIGPDQAADVLEVIEDRAQLRSTIVTSQLPVQMWHEALGEPTIADGILDRLLQNVHRIELRGESMRRTQGQDDTPVETSSTRPAPPARTKEVTPSPPMRQKPRNLPLCGLVRPANRCGGPNHRAEMREERAPDTQAWRLLMSKCSTNRGEEVTRRGKS